MINPDGKKRPNQMSHIPQSNAVNETMSHVGETQTVAKIDTTSHPHQMQMKGRGATAD